MYRLRIGSAANTARTSRHCSSEGIRGRFTSGGSTPAAPLPEAPEAPAQGVAAAAHQAHPVLLNLGEPGGFPITLWAVRVQLVDADVGGTGARRSRGGVYPAGRTSRGWERGTDVGLEDALTRWFGQPAHPRIVASTFPHPPETAARPEHGRRRRYDSVSQPCGDISAGEAGPQRGEVMIPAGSPCTEVSRRCRRAG